MIKFKSRYPNVTYANCSFNEECVFFANERQAEDLRNLKSLILTHDIEEIGDEPIKRADDDKAETGNGHADRYEELKDKIKKIGGYKKLTKKEQEEYLSLKKELAK